MKLPPLTVRAIHSVAVEVPITYALGTSRGVISKAPLLLIDLQTEEGVTGRSYLWCYFPAAMDGGRGYFSASLVSPQHHERIHGSDPGKI